MKRRDPEGAHSQSDRAASGGKGEHDENDDARGGDGVSDGGDDDNDDELWRTAVDERGGEVVLVAPRAEAARHCAKGRESRGRAAAWKKGCGVWRGRDAESAVKCTG